MATDLEFEEKNVDIAVEKACRELNIGKESLVYDVISYGSTGIFGLVGSKKAKIRVKITRETNPEQHLELAPNPGRPDTAAEDHQSVKRPSIHLAQGPKEVAGTGDIEETIDLCRQALQRIIDTITSEASISVEKGKDYVFFDIKGGNASVLIGKRGQTLEAIQYLIEKIANRRNGRRMRILVDVEGYLKTRRNNLEKLAVRLAEKAVRTGKPMTIGQMSSHDRRIVHLALKDDNDVRTQSLGNGIYRKLMIFPKKKTSGSSISAKYG
jgi:spoIIIJ-associated protein